MKSNIYSWHGGGQEGVEMDGGRTKCMTVPGRNCGNCFVDQHVGIEKKRNNDGFVSFT